MGTPSQATDILVPYKKIERPDLILLVESRRSLIRTHLDSFTLPVLGMVECLESGSFKQPLQTMTSDSELHREILNIQGIFCLSPASRVTVPGSGFQQPIQYGGSCPDGSINIWGLARSGEWTIVEVEFRGAAGYKNRGCETASQIKAQTVELSVMLELAKVEPFKVLEVLSRAIVSWHSKRRGLMEDAERILSLVQNEERLLQIQLQRSNEASLA